MIEIETLRKYSAADRIFATNHASERFHQRGVNINEIFNAIDNGEII